MFSYDRRLALRLLRARLIAQCCPSSQALHQLTRLELKCDRAISRRSDFADILSRTHVNRVFVMGCGRSGTWLAYSLLSMAQDAYFTFEEVDVGRFARIRSRKAHHLLKRNSKSFEAAHSIPTSVGILWLVRHPFDVLTSQHPGKGQRQFHIHPQRWNGEMDALRKFHESGRPNGMVIRYEDLVNDPERIVSEIAATFSLTIRNVDQWVKAPIPAYVGRAMHGVRPICARSVNRWKSDPDLAVYLDEILPIIQLRAEWVSKAFHYDL